MSGKRIERSVRLRREFCVLVGFAVFGAAATVSIAQEEEPKPSARFLNLRFNEDFSYLDDPEGSYVPDRGDFLKNIQLSEEWRFDFGGEFRFRLEARDNHSYFGGFGGPQNTMQLYRYMLHANFRYWDLFRLFVQGIVADAEDQDTGFNALQENHGDLQQLFFDIHFGEGSPWFVRLGRQELLYGNVRFVSPLEWASTRRRFDAVKLVFAGETWHIEGFYAKPVVVKRDQGDDWNEDYDFGGIYATYKGWSNRTLDLYFLAIDRTQDTTNPNGAIGDQSIYTLGARYAGFSRQWDYELEADYQWGKWAGDDVSAWSVAFDAGYTFAVDCAPRLGVGFDWATGDDDPTDGDVETFNQMFPLGHKYLGFMDLIGRQNITAANVNVSAWIIPEQVRFAMAFHGFWLEEKRDALYNAGGAGTLRDPMGDSGKDIGTELDVTVNWSINNHSSLLVGYSHFWDASVVDSLAPGDGDPDFFYLQYQYKF